MLAPASQNLVAIFQATLPYTPQCWCVNLHRQQNHTFVYSFSIPNLIKLINILFHDNRVVVLEFRHAEG
jgi:hypothetical protein